MWILLELIKLADYYGEENLGRRCEQHLKLLTTMSNVTKVYSVAVRYNSTVTCSCSCPFIESLAVANSASVRNIMTFLFDSGFA